MKMNIKCTIEPLALIHYYNELCPFYGSDPIEYHWEYTKWRISPKKGKFGRHEWQFSILLIIPVILVCHKPWFEKVLLWPTFWPLPIFDPKGQTKARVKKKLDYHFFIFQKGWGDEAFFFAFFYKSETDEGRGDFFSFFFTDFYDCKPLRLDLITFKYNWL